MSTEVGEVDRDIHDYGALPVASSVINSRTSVDGTIKSSTDLRIDGMVNGAIECEGVLYVSEGAVIDATIEAGGIVVEGSLSGTILCHGRLEIRATGHVNAEVATERLMIHEGAVYEGRLHMETPTRTTDASEQSDEPEAAEVDDRPLAEPYPYLRSFSATSTIGEPDDRDLPGAEGDNDRT